LSLIFSWRYEEDFLRVSVRFFAFHTAFCHANNNEKKVKRSGSQRGFTILELIVVLLIIGILTAVAAPKFINIINEVWSKAAQVGINKARAFLSSAYNKTYLTKAGQPTIPEVQEATGLQFSTPGNGTSNVRNATIDFDDIHVNIKITPPNKKIIIKVDRYNGMAWKSNWGSKPGGSWTLPEL
jgi:prepilin-type N-terminal cleavage/methylation domain-containing protein